MKKIYSFVFIAFVFCFYSLPVFAQTAYKNQENIPGQGKANDLVVYLDNLYNFGIAIAAILAIFMIALGAFNYIVTSVGNASKMIDAKEMIWNAIIGLVLVFVAFLILFIINPDLVKGTILGPTKVIEQITK